ncbi:MAG TPA: hypothetical protein VM791_15055, partial [Vicinamibacterales bacterium]|nr:hypothetical protein [Vicinamibacterales bacterium]
MPDSPAVDQVDSMRRVLRHLAATLAYRAAKVLRDTPAEFPEFSLGPRTRRPLEIVAHLADLMAWAVHLARGEHTWNAAGSDDWEVEVQRFFDGLSLLDGELAAREITETAMQKLTQGPLADALTHVGQLAMLRGVAGAPIRPESYARAEIVAGR